MKEQMFLEQMLKELLQVKIVPQEHQPLQEVLTDQQPELQAHQEQQLQQDLPLHQELQREQHQLQELRLLHQEEKL